MPRYGVETKKSPEEAIEAALAYFGAEGIGLEAEEEGPCCATFEGGGGFVRVMASESEEGDGKTTVTLETREWDYDVKQFMRKIG